MNHPDIRVMDKQIQEKRYNHKEEKKKIQIKEGIERRKEMIENPDKIFSKVTYLIPIFF